MEGSARGFDDPRPDPDRDPAQGKGRRRGLDRQALGRTLGYMRAHLDQRIGLPEMAAAACMSRFHFARLFRRTTGCSPMEYLQGLRLGTAARMLSEGRFAMGDIALATGFCDQSHFCRVFRRRTGMTPRQYARRCADGLPLPLMPAQAQ